MDVSGINGGEALVLIKRQLWPGWGSISSIRIVIFIQKTRERETDTLGDVAVVIPNMSITWICESSQLPGDADTFQRSNRQLKI